METLDPSTGDWGTVCRIAFGYQDASVVCRQLGFSSLGKTTIPPPQWRIQNFEKGVLDSAIPTLATLSFSNNAESAEFLSMPSAAS